MPLSAFGKSSARSNSSMISKSKRRNSYSLSAKRVKRQPSRHNSSSKLLKALGKTKIG